MGVTRTFAADLGAAIGEEVWIAGWIHALRTTKSTTFLVLRDASGDVQVVAPPGQLGPLQREDAVRLRGRVRADARAAQGFEVDALELQVVGAARGPLPIETHRDPEEMGLSPEILLDCRPLALRTDRYALIFRLQAALLEAFRAGLRRRRFTEIVSSKLVAGGTEGGAHLFALQYFERVAYLAQSPQFYKEHGVLGFERVFETGHVYRAEPHATARHLTEYYSLDLEFGFIDGPQDVIELERELLGEIFEQLHSRFGPELRRSTPTCPRSPRPRSGRSMSAPTGCATRTAAPTWTTTWTPRRSASSARWQSARRAWLRSSCWASPCRSGPFTRTRAATAGAPPASTCFSAASK